MEKLNLKDVLEKSTLNKALKLKEKLNVDDEKLINKAIEHYYDHVSKIVQLNNKCCVYYKGGVLEQKF